MDKWAAESAAAQGYDAGKKNHICNVRLGTIDRNG